MAPLQCNCRKVEFLSLSVSLSLFSPHLCNINENMLTFSLYAFSQFYLTIEPRGFQLAIQKLENNKGFCLLAQFLRFSNNFKLKY